MVDCSIQCSKDCAEQCSGVYAVRALLEAQGSVPRSHSVDRRVLQKSPLLLTLHYTLAFLLMVLLNIPLVPLVIFTIHLVLLTIYLLVWTAYSTLDISHYTLGTPYYINILGTSYSSLGTSHCTLGTSIYIPLQSMNPRPNMISYPVCIEDGGGNGGKSGFG